MDFSNLLVYTILVSKYLVLQFNYSLQMEHEFANEVAIFGVQCEKAVRCLNLKRIVRIARSTINLGTTVKDILLHEDFLTVFYDRH